MPMYSACGNAALPALGFPIRASADRRLFSASPRLIAAVHALHRLLVPRHPPCALPILTVIRPSPAPQADPVGPGDTRIAPARERTLMLALLCSFQGPWKGAGRTGRRSLKTQQHAGGPEGTPCSRLGRRSRSRHRLEVCGMQTWTNRPLQSWSSLERR
jgi:hypothetical protein